MSNKYIYDITYAFGHGRKEKLFSKEIHGKEFFYGYPHFENKGYKLNIIETSAESSSKYFKKTFLLFDKFFAKFTKLTFYMNVLISKKTLSEIYNSKNIVTSNHGIGMSFFIFIFFMKKLKKINFVVILSGLFAMKKSNLIVRILRKLVFTFFLITVDKLVFTNRSEFNFAIDNFEKFRDKFVCLPFCLDENFWKINKEPEFNKDKKEILFIGNNGHRDFDLVIKIANELRDLPFTFITNRIKNEDIKSENVKNIAGDWNLGYLSDLEIKKYYEKSRLVILPINNTLVSSGQSAGLQAASVGTPVMTTKTIGFWDYDNYEHNENIIFINNNELDVWVSEIKEIYNNIDKLELLSKNGLSLVHNKYKLSNFDLELERHLIL